MLGRGVDPKIVQEMLGHSTITQTMDTYSHVLPDMEDQAVSVIESALTHNAERYRYTQRVLRLS